MGPAILAENSDRTVLLCVCVATYKRQEMLGQLIDELDKVSVPGDCRLSLIIVDNDPDGSAQSTYASYEARGMGFRLHYFLEEKRGVSNARNRAIEESIALDSDYTLFIDDDETPETDWLPAMYGAMKSGSADLAGGPVFLKRPTGKLTAMQSFMFSGLRKHMAQKAGKAKWTAQQGRLPTIITNNWCARTSFLKESGLRFRERYGLSGGEDTDFFFRFVKSGGNGIWCDQAKVIEVPTRDRLSLGYQLARNRGKSLVHFMQKKERGRNQNHAVVALNATVRILTGAILVVICMPLPWAVVAGTRSIGWGLGRLDGLKEKESTYFASAR